MDFKKEIINIRTTRLNNIILGISDAQLKLPKSSTGILNREGLLDSLVLLYDECNKDGLCRKDKNIQEFITKHNAVIAEAKSLRVNITDFEVKKLIGKGHFGEVHLVVEKQTNDVYAMKKITKALVNSSHFKEERDIMACYNSDWITSLQYAFQDVENLYLIMEYLPGGDLLSLMERYGPFEETDVKFYLAEIAYALNELHNMGFVHRDVKPENILIDRCGHLKLADFGNAAPLNKDGDATVLSPAGTPEYIAPEILDTLNSKRPFRIKQCVLCDYWGMGIIGYEFITETTPFHGDNQISIYDKITNHCRQSKKLAYPENIEVSGNFRNLIDRLVTKPELRLTFTEMKKHSFFDGIQWDDLRNEVPPIIPTISSEDDVSNFNHSLNNNKTKQDTFVKNPSHYILKNNEFSGINLPYIGYTFARHEHNFAMITSSSESDDRKTKVKLVKYEEKVHELNKEVKKLQTDLLEAQRKSSRNDSLEKILSETKSELYAMKDKLNKKTSDLASSRTEIETLKSHLKIERENCLKNEAKIKDIFRSTHEKYEKEKYATDKMHEKQMFEKNNELSHITEKLKNVEIKLKDKFDECEHLQKALSNYKEILKQSKQQLDSEKKEGEESKKVIQDAYETKLNELRNRLKLEKDVKTQKCNEINELRMELNESVCSSTTVTENKRATERAIDDLKRKLNNQMEINSELHESNVKLEKEYAVLQMQFDNFRKDMIKLKEIAAAESNRSSCGKSDDSSHFKSANDSFVEVEEQLRNDLIVAKENENLSLKKVKDLEEMIKKLETVIANLQQPTAHNNELLEKKNEKLEDKLEAMREQAIVERQSARSANLALWKLEKKIEDFDLEKKSLLRRLELSDTKQLKLKEEKMEFESKLKQANEMIQFKEQTIDELKRDIDLLKVELKKESDLCKNTEKDRMKEKYEVISSIDKIKNLEEKLAENNKKLYSIQSKGDLLHAENNKMTKELNECQNTIADLSESLSATQHEYNNAKRNYNMLMQACKITETQLNEIETMYENEVKRSKSHTEKIDELWTKIRGKDDEIKAVKTELNQELHAKKVIEQKLVLTEKELNELKHTNHELARQCVEQQKDLIDKSKNLCSIQEDMEMVKLDSTNLERVRSHIHQELSILKEENAKILTELYLTKEELQKTVNELKESRNLNGEYKSEIEHMSSTMNEIKNYYAQREIKYDTTLAQHAKLINHLQVQVEESKHKKKKNITERLFGSSNTSSKQPQNLPLSAIENSATFKRLQQEYRQEKSRNERLTEQLLRVKTDMREQAHNKENHIEKYATVPAVPSTPRSDVNKVAIVAQVHRPQSAASCDELDKHHRFEMTIETQTNAICKPCGKPIMCGSTFWKCKQCKTTVHRKCRGMVNSLCDVNVTMTPSEQDIDDLCNEIFDDDCANDDDDEAEIPNEKSVSDVILVPTKYDTNLVVHTAYELNEDVMLLGCNTGLYSFHLETKSLVHIAGIDGVEYIAITPTVSKAILIGSRGENLYQCDLRHLQSRGQALSCLNPKLDVVLLEYSFLRKLADEKYHYAKIHGDNNKLQDVRVVAGTTARILIFQYDVQMGKFTPLRALDTAIPISAVLFTAHTVIISSDKFFEVDLKTFDYEELLDFSDKSVKHAQGSKPMAAFRINKEEYLLCFMDFGIFVDEFGCRSRSNDINWMTNQPTGFTYREPLLYISHAEQVEILFINKSYSKVLEVANYNDNIMCKENNYKKQILLNIPHTKILADVGTFGIVVAANNRNTKLTEVVHVNGAKLLKTELECSMDSLLTVTSSATTFDTESN